MQKSNAETMFPQPSNGNFNFDVPEITHHAPQVFGAFNPDGSPMPAVLPGQIFQENGEAGSLDELDAKRRRIARACDMCRRKKIKCDGRVPKCSHCENYKTDCVFTQVEKKRNPPKGAKYIESLENRLARMENLLRLSGLLSEEESGGEIDLATLEKRLVEKADETGETGGGGPRVDSLKPSHGGETPYSTLHDQDLHSSPGTLVASPEPERDREKPHKGKEEGKRGEVEALSEMMCSLHTNQSGESRYFGSSSGFSIFSPKGIQWVNEKTGDASFQEMVSTSSLDDGKWIYWKPEIFGDIFHRHIYQPLPPEDEAMSLLKDFFENFNCMFPLFHEATFMRLAERQYSPEPYEGSGWWASINVALAIAHRLRVMSQLVPAEEDEKGWMYLKNAMSVLTELTMRNTDLFSVQALLGMCMFLQGTPNPQPSFFLLAAAIRLSHSMGLHKKGSAFSLGPAEAEQRNRVFWIGYMLDKDICLRSGRPPLQDDDDMNVDLPVEDPPDNIGNIPLADGRGKVNLFRLMCTFASISSRVYRRLYSVKASRQSDGELLNTIGELDKELEEWKDGIPLDFRPEHDIKASHTPLILHVVVLHFGYYNCLTTIHRMSIHHGFWTNRLSNYAIQGLNAKALNPRVFASAALSVSAARASIHLIKYLPQGDFACVWMILYFPVSALVTLFANILQNPHDPRARADVKLMNLVVNFLTMLVTDDASGSVKRMLSVCAEFERIASVVIDKADEGQSRRKRKPAVDGSAEDKLAEQMNVRSSPFAPTATSVLRPTPPPSGMAQTTSAEPGAPGVGDSAVPNGSIFSAIDIGNVYSPPAIQLPGQSEAGQFPSLMEDPSIKGVPTGFGHTGAMDVDMSQGPYVPPDVWQMQMLLGTGWNDMIGGDVNAFERFTHGYDQPIEQPVERTY